MSFAEVVILLSQQMLSFELQLILLLPTTNLYFPASCLFAVYTNICGVCLVNIAVKSEDAKALGGPHNLWVQSDAKSDVLVWQS